MAKGDAEGRELPIGAPHAGYPHGEKEGAETKEGRSQKFSYGCLYERWEIRLIQVRPQIAGGKNAYARFQLFTLVMVRNWSVRGRA